MRPPSSIAMSENSNNRRTIGLTSLIVGVLLSIAAMVAFISLPATEVGNVAAVEDDLRSSSPALPSPSETSPPIESTAATDAPSRMAPLWQPNDQSLLSDVAAETGPKPTGIVISGLSVEAPITPYGINERTGQMAIPRNVNEVGWYRYGPTPGAPGSAVLAAHVDLESQGPGVFFNLKQLEPGDLIRVLYEDGTQREFEVEARTTYLKDELPLDVIFSRSGPPVLTLVTCGGGFNSGIAEYDSNVVVFARPVADVSPALEAT